MPKIWTWLVLLLSTASAVTLVDQLTGPERAAAQAGSSLSEPIWPVSNEDRRGSTQNSIGWTHAKKRYQADMPIGRGIIAGQVEARFRGGFMARTGGPLPATGFVAESADPVVSAHAVNVAVEAFGTDSAGLGVREVRCWELGDWLGEGYLRTGTTQPPIEHPARVLNHSWISSGQPSDPLVLRRVDYVVDAYDRVVVCGVNNGPGPVPSLLASAYNVISVGKQTGDNSDGLTTVEGEGRCKPDLVAPGGTTSGATGVVTGCVAALLELADRKAAAVAEGQEGGDKNAARSEVIKAALLAGARRPGRWAPPAGEPLDRSLGAGVVDLDRSLAIVDGGHVEPDRAADMTHRYGWSFASIKAGQTRTYTFTVDSRQRMAGFALTWHRRVLGGVAKLRNNQTGEEREVWNSGHFTPDLDLELVRHVDDKDAPQAPGDAADGEAGTERIAISDSKVDNVELIHRHPPDALMPGRYTLRVTRAADDTGMAWDYALAWKIEPPRQ